MLLSIKMTRFKYSLVLIYLLAGFPAAAQLIDMNLVVVSPNGKKFTLYVNDQKINPLPQADVKAFHINEGWCKLKAEFEEDAISVTDSIKIKALDKNNNKELLLSINQIDRYNKKTAKFEFISIGEPSAPPLPVVPEIPVYLSKLTENAAFGNLYQIKNNKPVFFNNYDSATAKCSVNLDEKDIEHFLFLIKKTNDFSNRITYVAKTVSHNCYTVAQLTQILNTLDTELDKLKYARKAYYHLLDKENAKLLVSVFNFKGVTEEYLLFLKDMDAEKHQLSMNCKEPVTDVLFNEIYVNIIKEKHEHDKAALAKKYVQKNCFSSAQMKKIIEVFSHDREKMELAKTAYPVITDKENYKLLAESFMFSENKNEFLNFTAH